MFLASTSLSLGRAEKLYVALRYRRRGEAGCFYLEVSGTPQVLPNSPKDLSSPPDYCNIHSRRLSLDIPHCKGTGMSDYDNEEEGIESLEDFREQEDENTQDEDQDWSDSLDDMESDDWSDQFGRSNIELEEVEDHEDLGDDEVDDVDLERIERDYFDEEEYDDSPDFPDPDPEYPDYPDENAASGTTSTEGGASERDNLIDRYVHLKSQLKEIQEELKDLKPRVLESLAESGVVVDDRIGTVKVAKRTQWRYSDDVTRLQAMIREKKKEEREAGIAVVQEETPYVVVRPGGGQSET